MRNHPGRNWLQAVACCRAWGLGLLLLAGCTGLRAQTAEVHDLPTRDQVTQRVLWVQAAEPKAIMVVLPGGHGGLQISAEGRIGWGETIFFVRNREALARRGVHVVLVDAPSDRPAPQYLNGHRQRPDHVTDLRAVIRWVRARSGLPVWLVGFSRGTQSAAHYAHVLADADDAPDAVVLAATIVADRPPGRPVADMPLERIRVPALWVHHEGDTCEYCPFDQVKASVGRMTNAPRTGLLSYTGGTDHPDRCGPLGHHGFRQLESRVEQDVIDWLTAHAPARAPAHPTGR